MIEEKDFDAAKSGNRMTGTKQINPQENCPNCGAVVVFEKLPK